MDEDLLTEAFCTSGRALLMFLDRFSMRTLSSPVSLKIFHSIFGCSQSSSVTSDEYSCTRPTHSLWTRSSGPVRILRNEDRTANFLVMLTHCFTLSRKGRGKGGWTTYHNQDQNHSSHQPSSRRLADRVSRPSGAYYKAAADNSDQYDTSPRPGS